MLDNFTKNPINVDSLNGFQKFIVNFIPILFFIIIFYFLLIRPNNKKLEERNILIKNLKIDDKIKTIFGIIGTIIKINENSIILKTGNSEIEIEKDSIENKL